MSTSSRISPPIYRPNRTFLLHLSPSGRSFLAANFFAGSFLAGSFLAGSVLAGSVLARSALAFSVRGGSATIKGEKQEMKQQIKIQLQPQF